MQKLISLPWKFVIVIIATFESQSNNVCASKKMLQIVLKLNASPGKKNTKLVPD